MASLLTLTFSQPIRTLAGGEVLVAERQPGGDLYVLESGRLIVERDGVRIATIDEPGALIGEMSVFLGTGHTATVRADRKATVRVVNDALAFLERQPLLTLRVATLLCARLNATSALLVELAKQDPSKLEEQNLLNRVFSSLMSPVAPKSGQSRY